MPYNTSATVSQVGLYMSIPILPISGIIVDRIGRRGELMIASFVLIFVGYIIMLLGPTYPHPHSYGTP